MKCLHVFYLLPLYKVIVIGMLLSIVWIISTMIMKSNRRLYIWKLFNIVLFILSLLLIIYATLIGRKVGIREVELIPFYTLTTISYNNEALRTMLMNVILFLPFGLTIPYVLDRQINNKRHKWCICVLSALFLSIIIESVQYYFCIGRAEMDDVICNTLGGLLGIIANDIGYRLSRKQHKHEQ